MRSATTPQQTGRRTLSWSSKKQSNNQLPLFPQKTILKEDYLRHGSYSIRTLRNISLEPYLKQPTIQDQDAPFISKVVMESIDLTFSHKSLQDAMDFHQTFIKTYRAA